MTFHVHRWARICEDHWVHFATQYIALPRPWLPLRMESSVSRDLCPYVPRMWGSSCSSSLVYVSGPGLCGGGGGCSWRGKVAAVEHPGVAGCVVVGGEEGVNFVLHEGHVR